MIFLLLSPTLWAETVSLEELLTYATERSAILKMQETDVLIESTNVQSARSAYYPSLNLVYNNEYTESLDGIPLGTESIGGITISNGTRYQSSLALQLNYDLYHFGATDKQVDIALGGVNIKNLEWCSKEKQLHQQILEHYASAQKASVEKKYRTRMYQLREELYKMKERLYKVGKYSKVDLGDEAIYMIGLQRDIENSSMVYQEDIIRLSELSRKKLSKDVVLLPMNINIKDISIKKYDETTEAIIFHKKIEQKQNEISLQFKQQLPSLGLYSSYYFYGSDPVAYDDAVSDMQKKSWNVGLAIRFNIFEGFKHSADKERLTLELQHLNQELEEASHNYSYDTQSKTTRINELETLKEHEQNLLKKNEKKIELVNRLYKAQRIDSITKINTEYELLDRALSIKLREIEAEFESESLNILHRGTKQCTQH